MSKLQMYTVPNSVVTIILSRMRPSIDLYFKDENMRASFPGYKGERFGLMELIISAYNQGFADCHNNVREDDQI